jgi:flagellar protein FliS
MNPYFEQMILSASPVELIRLLYRRALAAVRDARGHLREGRIAERCASINVAYAVLLELTGSLVEDNAPELTARLRGLYIYMQERLIEANSNQADAPLVEVLSLLTTLSEAWDGVSEAPTPEPATQSPWASSSARLGADGAIRIGVSA